MAQQQASPLGRQAPLAPAPSSSSPSSAGTVVMMDQDTRPYNSSPAVSVAPVPYAKNVLGLHPSARRPIRLSEKVSIHEIQYVQTLVEKCMKQYLNESEIIETLFCEADVEPGFSGLVLHKLEEQNPVFFKAYSARLQLKDQIIAFNVLMTEQLAQMQKLGLYIPMSAPPVRQGGAGNLPSPRTTVYRQHSNSTPPSMALGLGGGGGCGCGGNAGAASNNVIAPSPLATNMTSIPTSDDASLTVVSPAFEMNPDPILLLEKPWEEFTLTSPDDPL